MSDDKKYQQLMADHVDRKIQREWEEQYSPEAVRQFSRPARVCEMCGKPMMKDAQTGEDRLLTEWERKYSIHQVCADEAQAELDRSMNSSSGRS